jgi:lipopolysaccharide export system permease protein
MSALTRYMIRQLAGPMLFFSVALTGVILLSQSLRMVDMIVNRGLSIGTFMQLSALLLPGAVALILPIALFCTVLFVFHRLRNDSELVVMWAAGCDSWSVLRPTLLVASVVMLTVMALNLFVTPYALRTFKDEVFEIRSSSAGLLIQEGEFNTPVDGLTVYVRARQPGGELEGIMVHDSRTQGRPVTMLAEKGALTRGPEGPRFLLLNGNRQEIDRATGALSLLYFDRYTLDLDRFATQQEDRWIEPSERYLPDLFNPGTSADDRRNAARLMAEGHRRLTTPLYAIAFALIGIAGVVGGPFNRRGIGWRLMAVGAVGIVFRVGEIGLGSFVAQEPWATPLLYVYVLAGIAIPMWVLLRRPQRRPPAALPLAEPA